MNIYYKLILVMHCIVIVLLCVSLGFLAKLHVKVNSLKDNCKEMSITRSIYKEISVDCAIFSNYLKNATVTAYSITKSQTDDTPSKTALMAEPQSGWTCAVSQDLLKFLGSKVYIAGVGVRKVMDLMNKRYHKRLDLCVPSKKKAKNFGVQGKEVVFLSSH